MSKHSIEEIKEFDPFLVGVRCSCGWVDLCEGFEAYLTAEESHHNHTGESDSLLPVFQDPGEKE